MAARKLLCYSIKGLSWCYASFIRQGPLLQVYSTDDVEGACVEGCGQCHLPGISVVQLLQEDHIEDARGPGHAVSKDVHEKRGRQDDPCVATVHVIRRNDAVQRHLAVWALGTVLRMLTDHLKKTIYVANGGSAGVHLTARWTPDFQDC